jgi:hypothetical protein
MWTPPGNSPHTASIHIIDNGSLLNIFYLYRPARFDGDEDENVISRGGKSWDRERWWHKLSHVCQRWRNVILGSATYLDLCLVCTWGTPVADMLTYSPPFPLIIDYFDGPGNIHWWDLKAAEGIILALELRDRIRRVRLQMPFSNLKKIASITFDKEYPVLEFLFMAPPVRDASAALIPLPETLQTPHLRHLVLRGFSLPLGPQLLATSMGVVTLGLFMDHPFTYFQPSILLRWISFMPQLEKLVIVFSFPIPNRDAAMRFISTSITKRITLPNFRYFEFTGVSDYVEVVVFWITTPRLEKLQVTFFKQPRFSVPRLLRFMTKAESLRFDSANFKFSNDRVHVKVYPPEEAEMHSLSIQVECWPLDLQVSSVAQISHSLSQVFSTVKHLTLQHEVDSRLYEEYNEVDHAEWRKLLRSFSNVKTLHIDDGFVDELSRCLQHDGEFSLELLPELQELTYSGSGDTGDLFTLLIDARQSAGRPVTVVRLIPRSVTPLTLRP